MSKKKFQTSDGVLTFDGSKCIHSRNCVLNRPDVFVPNVQGDWIHPDKATTAELIQLADACPSGAIEFQASTSPTSAPLVNTLHIRENGPYTVKAELALNEHKEGVNRTLCRCGASKNKPFCDGSHTQISFVATGEPETKVSKPLENRGGLVELKTIENGPLSVNGSLEICSGTGRTVDRTEQVFLCRCGASANKPYCDGSHNRVGFVTDD